MPRYIRLLRLTDQAKRNIDRVNDMFAEARRIAEASGVKIVEGYSTLGRYDVVGIWEAPDDAAAMKASAMIAKAGNFVGETLPAFRIEDFAKAVSKK